MQRADPGPAFPLAGQALAACRWDSVGGPEARWLIMQVHDSLIELVGNTPLLRLRRVTKQLGRPPRRPAVLAKVEYFNPGGSVKDRIALRMVEAAEASGALQPGGTIVEPTSGNTGVGLAIVAQQKGYRCLFVCPDKVGQDKISVLRAYGAEVVVCPTTVSPDHPDSYYSVSDRLAARDARRLEAQPVRQPGEPGLALPHDRARDLGADRGADHPLRGRHRHRRHDLRHRPVPQGRVRRPGAGHRRGPGGVGLLRRHRPPVPGRGRRRGHLAGDLRQERSATEIIAVSDADSFLMTRRLAREEALLTGGSCGMAVVAALQVAAERRARTT